MNDAPASAVAPPATFDLFGPLPTGHLAIEASAGTGKTFTLAALAVRFIAEAGIDASELLMVTFTRAATVELRGRVRDRLVECADFLTGGEAPPPDDELLTWLAAADRAERATRLRRAVADFDAATITTIHGFASQVLAAVGAQGDVDPDAPLVDDIDTALEQIAGDVLAAASATHPVPDDLPTYNTLIRRARSALNMTDLVLRPTETDKHDGGKDLLTALLVGRVRDEMRARGPRWGTRSYNEILTDLDQALTGPSGASTLALLRQRYAAALIDEFQDTDPVQWEIFARMFPLDAPTRLVLVADPKQAIYSFRGANVHTYVNAVNRGAGIEQRSLGVNWRSDGALLEALDLLFEGTWFGDPSIRFHRVEAAPRNRTRRMHRDDGQPVAPIAIRAALGAGIAEASGRNRAPWSARLAVARDLVAQVRDALDHMTVPGSDGDADASGRRLRPSDVAVLVRSNADAMFMRDALRREGVAAVLARSGSVVDSPAADQWRTLLAALARPADARRARAFAISWFGGYDADWLASADDDALIQVQEQLLEWSTLLASRGVSDLVRIIRADTDVAARVLARPDGDREMTDLEHVAELLQSFAGAHSSAAALLTFLDTPPDDDTDPETDNDVTARRLESEADAVQVLTVWTAKGLEFPLVCCPVLWTQPTGDCIYQEGDERVFDVSNGADWAAKGDGKQRKRRSQLEQLGESLRLLYVALTRAQHRTIVWWSSVAGSNRTALAHLLFARTGDDARLDPAQFGEPTVTVPKTNEQFAATLEPLAARADGLLDLATIGMPPTPTDVWIPPERSDAPATELEVATLDRALDRARTRWSFSAIVDRAHAQRVDPYDLTDGDAGAADEPTPTDIEEADEPVPSSADANPPAPNALADLPAGAAFGTLVHEVLEALDTQAPDLRAEVDAHVERALSWARLDLTPTRGADASAATGRRLLVDGLVDVVNAPLGAPFDGRRLRDIAGADRLCELVFDMRLGDDSPPRDREIGVLVARHLPGHDPLLPWAEGLADGAFGVRLAGHLTGSIDAVFRVRDGSDERFVIADYKTNRLHPYASLATAADYAPDRLAAAMAEHHYPLQALLYAVAVHRYLRARLPGYAPERHLGGAAYLFVRGMQAAPALPDGDPQRVGAAAGVFTWAIPPALVTELSDLLAGRITVGTHT